MSACIDFGRGCVDQWAIEVKDPQGHHSDRRPRWVELVRARHASLNHSSREIEARSERWDRRQLAKRNKLMPGLIPKDLAHTAKTLEQRQSSDGGKLRMIL